MKASGEKLAGGRSGRSRRPFLLLLPIAVFACFSVPAGLGELSVALTYLSRPPQHQLLIRTSGLLPAIREIQRRVPLTEPVLIDVPQDYAPLHRDRIVNYWLYPRTVYSTHALRLLGEDVGRFTRARRIEWLYDGRELRHLGSGAPPPAAADLPCSLYSSGALRVAAGLLAALAHFLVVGFCILEGTGAARLLPSRIERVAASYLVGAGAVGGWTLLCFAVGLGVGFGTVALSLVPSLLLAALGRGIRRRRPAAAAGAPDDQPTEGHAGAADRVAVVIAAVLLGALLFRAVALPMWGYDDRYQWAHKAHVMLHEKSIWGSGFQDPHTLHFHPRYPLLVPATEAVVFVYAGGFNDRYAKLLFPLFLGAALVVIFFGSGALGRAEGRGLAVLALLLVPYYWGYQIGTDRAAAFAAYPDLVLSAFLVAAMVYFLRAQQAGSNRLFVLSALLLLFAALSKSEGKVHALVFLILAAGWMAWSRGLGRHLLRAGAAFAVTALLIALHEIAVVWQTQPGILPDDYSELLTWSRLFADPDRAATAASIFSADFFLSPRLGFLGLLLVAAVVLGGRRSAPRDFAVPLLHAAAVAAFFWIPYAVLPADQWPPIYVWSAGRLISQVLPVAFLAVLLLVLPGDSRSPREGGAPDRPRSGNAAGRDQGTSSAV